MVLVSAAALVMLLLPVETCTVGVRCRRRRWPELPRVTVRAALLVCSVPTLLVALTGVQADQGRRSGVTLAAALGPALSKVMM